jgi:hypothetical protein
VLLIQADASDFWTRSKSRDPRADIGEFGTPFVKSLIKAGYGLIVIKGGSQQCA